MKGVYDAADSVPGYRIAYLTFLASLDSFGKFILCFGAYLLSLLFAPSISIYRRFFYRLPYFHSASYWSVFRPYECKNDVRRKSILLLKAYD